MDEIVRTELKGFAGGFDRGKRRHQNDRHIGQKLARRSKHFDAVHILHLQVQNHDIEIGMTKNQVRFLLGTPMIDDPFHADRWDYVYYLKIGRNQAVAKRWVSVFFEDGVVSEIRKDQELNPDL